MLVCLREHCKNIFKKCHIPFQGPLKNQVALHRLVSTPFPGLRLMHYICCEIFPKGKTQGKSQAGSQTISLDTLCEILDGKTPSYCLGFTTLFAVGYEIYYPTHPIQHTARPPHPDINQQSRSSNQLGVFVSTIHHLQQLWTFSVAADYLQKKVLQPCPVHSAMD